VRWISREELEELKQWFAVYVRSFCSGERLQQRNFLLKEEHTLRVCEEIKAIGQEKLVALYDAVGVEHASGYVRTDGELRTSNPKVFAAGDCVRATGQALTVTASMKKFGMSRFSTTISSTVLLPLSRTGSRASHVKAWRAPANVDSPITIWPGCATEDSRRLAMFTTSPITV